jgi:YHS domain-containing protein
VAYFTEGRPIKGDAHFFTQYEGVQWRFSSAKNRALFLENPQKYAPQYGGYCAWAVSQGYTASADPLRWRIVEGKLYLNYDADVQKKWEANIPDFIQKANQNWPNVLN